MFLGEEMEIFGKDWKRHQQSTESQAAVVRSSSCESPIFYIGSLELPAVHGEWRCLLTAVLLGMDGREKTRFKWKSKAKGVGVVMLEYCCRTEWVPLRSFSQSVSFFRVLWRQKFNPLVWHLFCNYLFTVWNLLRAGSLCMLWKLAHRLDGCSVGLGTLHLCKL